MRSCMIILAAFFCAIVCSLSPPALAERTVTPFFASSGLLAKADESAEEILLRAHHFDRGALILTIIGYYQGLGGFPQSPNLAVEWTGQLVKTNDLASLALLSLMIPAELFEADGDAEKFALCPAALGNPLAPILKQEGLFDVEQYCDKLKETRELTPYWDKRYADTAEVIKTVQNGQTDIIRAVRAFRDEPCSPELETALYDAQQKAMPDSAILYAATTHNPATESPDWSADRLLQFLDKLEACTRQTRNSSSADREKAERIVDMLTFFGKDAIFSIVAQNRDEILLTIRSAHNLFKQDSLEAMRAMAMRYRDGSPGFPHSTLLSDLWLQHAAFACDDHSRLLLALSHFADKRYPNAWAWADVIAKNKDGDEQSKKMAARLTAMIESRAGNDVRQKGQQFVAAYFKATKELFEWLEKQEPQEPEE